jgi:hypothetical protein
VVVLPEPVGPGQEDHPVGVLQVLGEDHHVILVEPDLLELQHARRLVEQTQHDALAVAVGTVLMRTSTSPWPTRSEARPSCGRRRSAMSIFPMTLTRLTMASCTFFGADSMS